MLPNEFKDRMKQLLKDKYEMFLETYNDSNVKSIRVNTNKISIEEFLKLNQFQLKQIPYAKDGFYIKETSLGFKTLNASLYNFVHISFSCIFSTSIFR